MDDRAIGERQGAAAQAASSARQKDAAAAWRAYENTSLLASCLRVAVKVAQRGDHVVDIESAVPIAFLARAAAKAEEAAREAARALPRPCS